MIIRNIAVVGIRISGNNISAVLCLFDRCCVVFEFPAKGFLPFNNAGGVQLHYPVIAVSMIIRYIAVV